MPSSWNTAPPVSGSSNKNISRSLRVDAAKQASAKRLHKISANRLQHKSKVTNYSDVFTEHVLAMGVVEGIHAAADEVVRSGDRRGPQLRGLTYSFDELGFTTTHNILTYAATLPSGYLGFRLDENSYPQEAYAVKIFSSDQSIKTASGTVTDNDPATRILAFDFDRKNHDEEVICSEVIALCTVLHKAGIYNWIVDSSTNGYHVLVMLNRPILLSDTLEFFNGFKAAFQTLDIQPMTSRYGAISVPFSRAKSNGTHRLLVHGKVTSFVRQHKVNELTKWRDISNALMTGLREYDRTHLQKINYDHRADRLAKSALEEWDNTLAIRHTAPAADTTNKEHNGARLEHKHLLKTQSNGDYRSASEHRFSLAGAMVYIYGHSDESLKFAATRLHTSNDPLPRKYRELVAQSSRKIPLAKALDKDLKAARATASQLRGWAGLANGATQRLVSISDDIKFTPEVDALAHKIVNDSNMREYNPTSVIRAFLRQANNRHQQYLDAVAAGIPDDELPDNPFETPVEFSLSMVTRMTGMASSTAYDNTMKCFKESTDDSDEIALCREMGAEEGLFCECHRHWQPYFKVAHMGHSGESDDPDGNVECRDHSFCVKEDGGELGRSSTFVQFKYAPKPTTDEWKDSWVYHYLISRDPIFNESALGAQGFHFYHHVSTSEEKVYLTNLRDIQWRASKGTETGNMVNELIDAGLLGRKALKGAHAHLLYNPVSEGSLLYRLRHERRAFALEEKSQFRSALLGTGNIINFIMQFSSDLPRLYAVVREVLTQIKKDKRLRGNGGKRADGNKHAVNELTGPDGETLLTVRDFCEAYDIPYHASKRKTFTDSVISGDDSDYRKHSRSVPAFEYSEGAAELLYEGQLFSPVHYRDDFVDTYIQLKATRNHLFGSSRFVPSTLLTEMFHRRRREFLEVQEQLVGLNQSYSPPDSLESLSEGTG